MHHTLWDFGRALSFNVIWVCFIFTPIELVYWIGQLTTSHPGRMSAVEDHITEVNRNSAPVHFDAVFWTKLKHPEVFPRSRHFSLRYGHAINRWLDVAKIMSRSGSADGKEHQCNHKENITDMFGGSWINHRLKLYLTTVNPKLHSKLSSCFKFSMEPLLQKVIALKPEMFVFSLGS